MTDALVIGGSGFIGSWIASELMKRGDYVEVMDIVKPRYEVPWKYGDIRYLEYFNDLNDYDEVYNLAGMLGTSELIGKEHAAVEVNIIGQLNVLKYAMSKNLKVFYPEKPAPPGWINTYTITKSAAGQFSLLYRKEFGVDVRMITWYNAVGPGERIDLYRKAVPYFIIQALKDDVLEVFGTGEQTMDIVYVGDVARIAVDFMRLPKEKIENGYELGGEVIAVKDLAKRIIDLVGTGKIKLVPMRKGEPLNSKIKADNTRLECLLGDLKLLSLDETLKRTVAWYAEEFRGGRI
jgi:nucleoside-diphosphate-sugar epimerase